MIIIWVEDPFFRYGWGGGYFDWYVTYIFISYSCMWNDVVNPLCYDDKQINFKLKAKHLVL